MAVADRRRARSAPHAHSNGLTAHDPLAWVTDHWDVRTLGEPTGMLALTSVFRLREHLLTAIEEALAPLKLSATDYLLLMTIRLADGGRRPLSRIAKAMMVHPTTVTQAVDRLEERGLVARIPHPSDRRATLATLTTKGTDACHEATRRLQAIEYGMPGVASSNLNALIAQLTPIRSAAGDVV